jgi:hypothetical protein
MAFQALLAAAAPYLISGAGGLLSSKTRSSAPGMGSQVMVAPQYSFTEPRLRLISDAISDNLMRIGRGEAPAYFERAVPSMRKGMERGVQTTYFGREGDRTGAVQAALEAGALAGTGSRPGTANMNKSLQRYEEASNAIEEKIAQMRMETSQNEYGRSMGYGIQMPKGPDSFVLPGYGPQQTPGIAPYLASILSNTKSFDWLKKMGLGGAMGGAGTDYVGGGDDYGGGFTRDDYGLTGMMGPQGGFFPPSGGTQYPPPDNRYSSEAPTISFENMSREFAGQAFNQYAVPWMNSMISGGKP